MRMYNLIGYSSNYSEKTRSFWFNNNSKDNFKPFKYIILFKYTKLLGNIVPLPAPNNANKILKNATKIGLLQWI